MKFASFQCKHQIETNFALVLAILGLFSAIHFTEVNGQVPWNTGTYDSDDYSLPYHLLAPEDYDGTSSYPLVLFLHGDNQAAPGDIYGVTGKTGPVFWSSASTQSKYPCFLLVPVSTKSGDAWVKPIGQGDYSTFLPIIALLDSLSDAHLIDTDRVYITGSSGGGIGTWFYIGEYPDYFAAALPICGGWMYSDSLINEIKHIPVWNHHGELDLTAPTWWSRYIFNVYDSIGLPVAFPDIQKYVKPKISSHIKQNIINDDIDYIYTEYQGVGHGVAGDVYADSMVPEWLFSKRKRTNGVIRFNNSQSNSIIAPNQLFKIICEMDTLDIALDYSSDLGYSWDSAGTYSSGIDSIVLNTEYLKDSPKGQFRIKLIDDLGETIGTDYTGFFKVDNESNCVPWLRYYISHVSNMIPITSSGESTIKYMVNVNDTENENLELSIQYKSDDSIDYQLVQVEVLPPSFFDQPVIINFDTLAYGENARIRFILTDGENVVSDSTSYFLNPNQPAGNIWNRSIPEEFKLYPNPVSDILTIESTASRIELIEIALLNGRIIFSDEINDSLLQIDVSSFRKGVYFITIRSKDFVTTRKIIKL